MRLRRLPDLAQLSALAVVGALALCARGDDPAAEGGWQPYAGTLPRVETDRTCVLVRDARTGAPIPWALVENRLDFVGTDAWGPLTQASSADGRGIAVMPPAEPGFRVWVVRAPGFAPHQGWHESAYQAVVDLSPAPAVHGRLLDVRGRPVAGAVVEWTDRSERQGPALGRTTTGPDGLYRMCVPLERADLTLVGGPGVANRFRIAAAPVWAAPPDTIAEPGRTLEGRVRVGSGRITWPRSLVAADQVRGALAPIDDQGGFRLVGMATDESTVYLHGYDRDPAATPAWVKDGPELDPTDWTPGRFVDWDVGAHPDDLRSNPRSMPVVVVGPREARSTRLRLDRLEDGRRFEVPTWRFESGPTAVGWIDLDPGTYVVARDEPFGEWAPLAATTHVPAVPGPASPLLVVLVPQPRLVIEGLEGVVGIEQVWLWASTPFGDRSVSLDRDVWMPGDHPVHVPADAEVGITASGAFGLVTGRAEPAAGGRRRVRLAPPPPVVVSLPEREPGSFEPSFDSVWAGGTSRPARQVGDRLEILVPPQGRLWLEEWTPVDDEQSRTFAIDVPDQPGAIVLVPPEAMRDPHPRVLTVRVPTEAVLSDTRIWSPRLVRSDLESPGWDEAFVSREPGGSWRLTSRALRDGAHVTLDLEGPAEKAPAPEGVRWCPLRLACAGEGPYVLEAPDGALALTVRAGDAAAVACLLDGDLFELGGASADRPLVRRLRAVRAGEHTLIVVARGRQSRVLRFTLKDGEERALDVALPPRE